MHVTHLSLADFRSYARAEVALDPGVTAFVGPNGQGKTNIVEAVGYLATLGSHRVSSDAPLVRMGAERAVIRAQVRQGERQQLVELELNPGKANRARINRSSQVKPRDVLGIVRTVLFAPEDLALVKGDPGERRLVEVLERIELRAPADVLAALPELPGEPFTTRELKALLGCSTVLAQRAVYCMKLMELIEPAGRRGRAPLHRLTA